MILSVVCAILVLGFLVFIHELGHYIVAKRKGMRVEVFSIGFGKPIFSWMRGKVRWQIGMVPFGGFVKIAGMQKEDGKEPFEIPDGFFGKTPWQRIQVALAGPIVNIVFALFAFTLLWMLGGREKSFSEFTHRIGWVDPQSELYQKGVGPGDEITRYDGKEFTGFKDLLISSLTAGPFLEIEGYKIHYLTQEKTPFEYTLKTYPDPRSYRDRFSTIGIFSPAQYLLFEGTLPEGSQMEGMGLHKNDRILWADGELLFSLEALSQIVNEPSAFLTVKRGEEIFHTKVPRVKVGDLKMSLVDRGEIDDWQHEASLKGKLSDLYFIPYILSPHLEVEGAFFFIDDEEEKELMGLFRHTSYSRALQEGDQILAISGISLHSSYQLLSELQEKKVLLITEANPMGVEKLLWTKADAALADFQGKDVEKLISGIGTDKGLSSAGSLKLLEPVTPKRFLDLTLSPEQRERYIQELAFAKKEIEKISDPEKRQEALSDLEKMENRLVLGLPLQDRKVDYNPSPLQQFSHIFQDTYRTLAALISGTLSPKYVSGPVGIVHIVQKSWLVGAKEALFWMGVISLNLGLINLLPIPVLDGGHIAFSLYEAITKRKISSKVMERMILPFVGLIVAFFLYITYQDIYRLFSKFF